MSYDFDPGWLPRKASFKVIYGKLHLPNYVENGRVDLFDTAMRNCATKQRTVTVEVSTLDPTWTIWDNDRIDNICAYVRYDIGFEDCRAKIDVLSGHGSSCREKLAMKVVIRHR